MSPSNTWMLFWRDPSRLLTQVMFSNVFHSFKYTERGFQIWLMMAMSSYSSRGNGDCFSSNQLTLLIKNSQCQDSAKNQNHNLLYLNVDNFAENNGDQVQLSSKFGSFTGMRRHHLQNICGESCQPNYSWRCEKTSMVLEKSPWGNEGMLLTPRSSLQI